MKSRLPMLSAVLMLGIATPLASIPAFAQDQQQQAVRDALGRAQTGAGQRAVEDLINRLRGTPAQAAPTPGAAPATAPAGTPPATSVSAPGTIPPTPPAAAATPTAVPTPPATAAAPTATTPAAPPAATTTAVPTAAPAAGATAARPVVTPMARPSVTPGTAPAVTPAAATAGAPAAVTLPRGSDMMAKAPEIAEKMNVPRADIEVFFDFNSAVISPKARETLQTMGQALADPRLKDQRFIIGGHTDGKGRADFNLNLSRRRAEAVRKFVIEQYKIEPNRLVARGYGKSRPKNTSMPLADENRRVQIINLTRMEAAMRGR